METTMGSTIRRNRKTIPLRRGYRRALAWWRVWRKALAKAWRGSAWEVDGEDPFEDPAPPRLVKGPHIGGA